MYIDSYKTIENVKKELKEEMKSSFCSIEKAMKKELLEMEERIIQRTEKFVSVIEDVLSMVCWSCLLGGTFDYTFMIPRVTLIQALVYIVELEPPSEKNVHTGHRGTEQFRAACHSQST